LDALVPAHLDAVPEDPIDGAPLRYDLRPPGYIVYSVADDGEDNGGRPRKGFDDLSGWDLGFRVWR
jgi:hypothetical protein